VNLRPDHRGQAHQQEIPDWDLQPDRRTDVSLPASAILRFRFPSRMAGGQCPARLRIVHDESKPRVVAELEVNGQISVSRCPHRGRNLNCWFWWVLHVSRSLVRMRSSSIVMRRWCWERRCSTSSTSSPARPARRRDVGPVRNNGGLRLTLIEDFAIFVLKRKTALTCQPAVFARSLTARKRTLLFVAFGAYAWKPLTNRPKEGY